MRLFATKRKRRRDDYELPRVLSMAGERTNDRPTWRGCSLLGYVLSGVTKVTTVGCSCCGLPPTSQITAHQRYAMSLETMTVGVSALYSSALQPMSAYTRSQRPNHSIHLSTNKPRSSTLTTVVQHYHATIPFQKYFHPAETTKEIVLTDGDDEEQRLLRFAVEELGESVDDEEPFQWATRCPSSVIL